MVICQNQGNLRSYLYYCCFVNDVDMNMFPSLITDLFAIFCFAYLYWRTRLSNFVTFPKIYLATFIQKKKENRIIDPLKGQRSADGIFKKLKTLDISLITIYRWKVFSSLISRKKHKKL